MCRCRSGMGGYKMIYDPKPFGTALKNARMERKLTQAELAEKLDISLSYLKDLERFRNDPSFKVFERTVRYFNISADDVIYPEREQTDETRQKVLRLLKRCDEEQMKMILAAAEALLSDSDKNSEPKRRIPGKR